jgi:hypothetical protein
MGFEFRLANERFLASDRPTPGSVALSERLIAASVTLKLQNMFLATVGKTISERIYCYTEIFFLTVIVTFKSENPVSMREGFLLP